MIRAGEIEDLYDGDRWLRRWTFRRGHARCVDDAHEVAETAQATRDAQTAGNATLRQDLADVEAYEGALEVNIRGEPEKFRDDGEGGQVITDDWTRWDQAQTTIAAVRLATLDLAAERR